MKLFEEKAIGERLNFIKLEKEKAQIKSIESQNMAIESLKRTDKMKDEFLANTSHVPLRSLIRMSTVLPWIAIKPVVLKAVGAITISFPASK